MSVPRIGVTGATGGLGGRVARLLAQVGVPQRPLVRDLPCAGHRRVWAVTEVAAFDYTTAMQQLEALAGLDTLLLVSAPESADRMSPHAQVVEAAVAARVRQVVYTSFVGAGPTRPSRSPASTGRRSGFASRGWRTRSRATTSTPTSRRRWPARTA